MGKLVRKSRIARSTGTKVELIDADHPDCSDFDSAEGGRWVTICEDHGGCVQHDVYRNARTFLAHPEDWCEGCQEIETPADSNGDGFSEEERKRGLETRRRKAAEAQKQKDEEEARRSAARALEEQWTVWVSASPVLEPLFSEEEAEEAASLRVDRATANIIAKEAKKTRADLERELGSLPERPTKKEGKEKRADLEKRVSDLDSQEVAALDKVRIADEALTRVSRIGYLRACRARHWRISKPGAYGRFLLRTGTVDLRIPDGFLDAEGYTAAGRDV